MAILMHQPDQHKTTLEKNGAENGVEFRNV